MKAAGLRVPDTATEEQRELADEALDVITAVMRGVVRRNIPKDVPPEEREDLIEVPADLRMRAAARIREEVCGPVKQRVEHSFDGLTDEQLEARYRALVLKAGEEPLTPADTEPVGEGER